MQYMLTSLELHLDKGFGVTADSYYYSAEHLRINPFDGYSATPQAEMPESFLYRHSIELYLKSLIIIFHKKLEINYGNALFDSEEPEVLIDGKWKKLYTCHFIDKLYEYWLNSLFLPNIDKLISLAPNGDWQENLELQDLLSIVSVYDKDSSYFRYPITKNKSLDHQKYSMQKFNSNDIDQLTQEIQKSKKEKGNLTMLILDDSDNILHAFKKADNILPDVRNALREIAYYLNCMHVMTRATLCSGM